MNDNARLEDMIRYLKLEVPHYLQDEVREVKAVGDFEYDLGGDLLQEQEYMKFN